MGLYKKLFKQTAIYGLAMVLPRMMGFFLVRFYTNVLPNMSIYGDFTIVLAYMVFFNVILSYGFETAFFRFYNSEEDKKKVISTATTSLFWSSMCFLFIALLFRNTLAFWINTEVQYVTLAIWILFLDALVVIPFSVLRAHQKPKKYALIKIGNMVVNLGFTFFFLYFLPAIAKKNPNAFITIFHLQNFELGYILLANIIASLLTFLLFLPNYLITNWRIDALLWKKMMQYGLPVLIAGIAFAINEHLDKILLEKLLPSNISKSEVGAYSACYKLGLFMVLFRTAYSLGIEPFFFSQANDKNAPETYATITKYFVILGSLLSLTVIIFADVLKVLLLDKETYWKAMDIVPIIVFANFFLGIYTNLSVWYKLIDKTKIGAYISIFGALITLGLNFLLIEKISYYGSALATIAAYGSMMVLSYYLGKNKFPIPYDKKSIFTYLSLSMFLSSISFYVPEIRGNFLIKITFLFIFLLLIYFKEKEVIQPLLIRKK